MGVVETAARRLGLERDEQRLLVVMGALVGTLLCAYTLAKVARDALFLAFFGALSLPYAYIGVALASVAFVWLDGRITRRYPRLNMTRFHQLLAIAIAVTAAAFYPLARHVTVAVFYLWTGSQAMLLIPHFWVLALDVWDSHRARRLFPLLTGCGLIGGLIGGGIAGWLTPVVKRVGLMWIVAGLFLVTHLLTRLLERHRIRRPAPVGVATNLSRWEIFRRSMYVKLLATALALSVVIGTLVDFQFKFFIQRIYPDPHDLTQFLGRFQVALNALALVLQFGVVGWLFHRLGLALSTTLQPASVMLFGWWVAATQGWWAVLAMRWAQGVMLQTVGKSSSEIYYMAIRPPERRRIKPVIDTLVERWSDAVVGVALLVLLRAVGVSISVLVVVTISLAALWGVVVLRLNHEFGRAFQTALGSGWIDPDEAAESLHTPAGRAAILQALRSGDERRMLLALRMARNVRHRKIGRAVRQALQHPSPAVRAAAVDAMEALGLRDHENVLPTLFDDPDDRVARAAVRALLATSRSPVELARGLLDGPDDRLRRIIVDALFERPAAAPGALSLGWVDDRIRSGSTEDLLLAARALGALPGSTARARLRSLLADPDSEVRRAALRSAARRPSRQLLESILPLLFVPELSWEARLAIAAIGDPAIPALRPFLGGRHSVRAQALAARVLAHIASRGAIDALLGLVRSQDSAQRLLGLRNLSRARVQLGHPVLPRGLVHRLFLREVRSYRSSLTPALELEDHPAAEVRLLGDSFRESAEIALERALRALACWYEPKPLAGALDRLKSREFDTVAVALEYLSHVLPRSIFRAVAKLFEEAMLAAPDRPAAPAARIAAAIEAAWRTGDAWLRACAVRASRLVPDFDASVFQDGAPGADGSDRPPIVQAELAALGAAAPAAAAGAASAARSPLAPPPC